MNNKSTLISIILILLASIYGAYYMKTNDLSIKDLLPKNNSNSLEKENEWEEWEKDKPSQKEDKKKEQPEEPKEDKMVIATSYKDAIQKANELNKDVFIFFTSDKCSWCDKMKKETFEDDKIIKLMSKFIFFECNFKENTTLFLKHKVISTPTCIIINKDEKVIKSDKGFKNPDELSNWIS